VREGDRTERLRETQTGREMPFPHSEVFVCELFMTPNGGTIRHRFPSCCMLSRANGLRNCGTNLAAEKKPWNPWWKP
jgi:hypothetical protein